MKHCSYDRKVEKKYSELNLNNTRRCNTSSSKLKVKNNGDFNNRHRLIDKLANNDRSSIVENKIFC
jgi:hypothetical protein